MPKLSVSINPNDYIGNSFLLVDAVKKLLVADGQATVVDKLVTANKTAPTRVHLLKNLKEFVDFST